jgi:hypothetical protein
VMRDQEGEVDVPFLTALEDLFRVIGQNPSMRRTALPV